MKEYKESSLKFVLEHYRNGRLNTSEAISRFRQRVSAGTVMQNDGDGTSSVSSASCCSPKSRRTVRYIAVSVAVAAVFAVCVFIFRNMEERSWTQLASAEETLSVVLPDSSVVTLAPNSVMSYKIGDKFLNHREVRLRGKAYFSVTRDYEHPFSVITEDSETKVLGTQFQVSEENGFIEVYVRSGKVSFAELNAENGVILTKRMAVRLVKGGGMPQYFEPRVLNPAAWATRVFEYDAAPVRAVLKDLSIFYGVQLTLYEGMESVEKHLNGRFFVDDMASVISAIEEALDIKIEVK